MGFVLFGILFFFGYPFIASVIASRDLRRRLEVLESLVRTLRDDLEQARKAAPATPAPQPPAAAPAPALPRVVPEWPPVDPTPLPSAPVSIVKPEKAPAMAAAAPPAKASVAVPRAAPQPVPPRAPRVETPPPAWLVAIKTWLFTGNLVAKLGLLILFIGVSFLLKYASERYSTPIELRLAAIVLADIALLAWGWRMRLTHRNLSLPIQGAALAILMLVTFGAFRLYGLIPPGLAFGLLFVLTAFTCLLAVLQDAVWLAVFGIAGGFLAPIMTSTGQGSHIALFSYYSLLNAGILAIALKRTWRSLNLLGFAFTFIIGTAWGVLKYSSTEHYLSTQLFLVLFFLFYVAIALVYAQRRSADQKAYVDATIVFGTALAAFGLQLGLMKHVEFGNAFSALGFGVFYTLLAMALWRRRAGNLKLLVESFLALGVVFGTLALPFALDGRWTSAAWALEGAGVAWVGLRQRQRLVFGFGMLVQAGAWLSFIGAIAGLNPEAARESNLWLGFLILAVTAFFMATAFRAQKDGDEHTFPYAATWFLGIAAAWFMGGAWTEIMLRQSGTTMANLLVASGLATTVILAAIAARMQWARARSFALAAQVLAGAVLLFEVLKHWSWTATPANLFDQPLIGALMIFAAALFTSWNLWRTPESVERSNLSAALLGWSAFWWFGPVLNALSGSMMVTLTPFAAEHYPNEAWPALYAACTAFSAIGFALLARKLAWTRLRWLSAPAWLALVAASLLILAQLYGGDENAVTVTWIGFGCAWAASEYLLRFWPAGGWRISDPFLKLIHFVRTAAPWIMLWKVGEIVISDWLHGSAQERQLLDAAGVETSGSWANFLPFWAMMLVVLWLVNRSQAKRWPTAPIDGWYRQVLIPAATAWSLLLMGLWNIAQDGSMAPLPYVPLVNPLDLSTGFALVMGVVCWRSLNAERDALSEGARKMVALMPMAGMVAAYVWLNLILLRTASHFLDIPYRFEALFASQFVQAMLSLVWSITALVLMRLATRKLSRKQWMVGAGFLALVVAKLFLVDLSGIGSVARIVSFVGVGLLMVLIGYLAPYPNEKAGE
ncbi:MAG: DUF2339 domain-containing protein [Pseudomonadota bacterium]